MSKTLEKKEYWVKCVNKPFSMDHLVSSKTRRTRCGLRWKKHVWIPQAVWFSSGNRCKRCFFDGEEGE